MSFTLVCELIACLCVDELGAGRAAVYTILSTVIDFNGKWKRDLGQPGL